MDPHILQSATLHTFHNETVYDHMPKDLKLEVQYGCDIKTSDSFLRTCFNNLI